MLTKKITYTDYDGETRTENFMFNLTEAELVAMDLSTIGGLEQRLEKIQKMKDTNQMLKIFEDLIGKAYGEKSDDGRRFIKSDELFENFKQTEAYSELFMELISEPQAMAAFFSGIVPKKYSDELAKNPDIKGMIE